MVDAETVVFIITKTSYYFIVRTITCAISIEVKLIILVMSNAFYEQVIQRPTNASVGSIASWPISGANAIHFILKAFAVLPSANTEIYHLLRQCSNALIQLLLKVISGYFVYLCRNGCNFPLSTKLVEAIGRCVCVNQGNGHIRK